MRQFEGARRGVIGIFLVLALAQCDLFGGNIVTNSGFELSGPGGPSDSLDWSESPTGISQRSLDMSVSGVASHFIRSPASSLNGAAVSRNGYDKPSLLENTLVSISFDANVSAISPRALVMSFRLTDANSLPLATPRIEYVVTDTNGSFRHFSAPNLLVPPFSDGDLSAYHWDLGFFVVGGVSSDTYAYIDNVVVDATLVPEPAAHILAWTLLALMSVRSAKKSLIL